MKPSTTKRITELENQAQGNTRPNIIVQYSYLATKIVEDLKGNDVRFNRLSHKIITTNGVKSKEIVFSEKEHPWELAAN